MNPIISVIVPVYNTKPYLERMIDSVLAQSYYQWEMVLVDDGSTDNSLNICRRYENNDNRIKVLHQENKGISSARNYGISVAEGDYFAFIDSDDYIHPKYLEILMDNLINNKADLSICSAEQTEDWASVARNVQQRKNSVYHCENNQIFRRYLFDTGNKAWAVWGKMIKKEICMKYIFNENQLFAEDQITSYHWFKMAKTVVDTDDVLYCWYVNPVSLTRNGFDKRMIGKLQGLLMIMEDLDEKTGLEDVYENYLHRFIYNAAYQFKQLKCTNEVELANSVRRQFKQVLKENKTRYKLTPKSDPDGFNVAYPVEMYFYWILLVIKSKITSK